MCIRRAGNIFASAAFAYLLIATVRIDLTFRLIRHSTTTRDAFFLRVTNIATNATIIHIDQSIHTLSIAVSKSNIST
jgi:hypothetical protein